MASPNLLTAEARCLRGCVALSGQHRQPVTKNSGHLTGLGSHPPCPCFIDLPFYECTRTARVSLPCAHWQARTQRRCTRGRVERPERGICEHRAKRYQRAEEETTIAGLIGFRHPICIPRNLILPGLIRLPLSLKQRPLPVHSLAEQLN